MFENIKPMNELHFVGLPNGFADTLKDVYDYHDIHEKTGIFLKGSYGAMRCAREPQIMEKYGHIQKQAWETAMRKFPDIFTPTETIHDSRRNIDYEGWMRFSACWQTNISEEDIWAMMDRYYNDNYGKTDPEVISMKEKRAKDRAEYEEYRIYEYAQDIFQKEKETQKDLKWDDWFPKWRKEHPHPITFIYM